LWLAIFFVVGQFGSGWAIDRQWPQIRFPHLYERLQRLDGQPNPPAVVCLGSSRIGLLLNGPELTHYLRGLTGDRQAWAFNGGVPLGDTLSDERILEELLKRGIRPRCALIEVSPLAVLERNPWAGLYAERQLHWSGLPYHVADVARQGQLLRTIQYQFLPLYGYRWQICQALSGALDECAAAQGKSQGNPYAVDLPESAADANADLLLTKGATWNVTAAQQPVSAEQLQASRVSVEQLTRDLRNYRPGGNLAGALERVVRLCQDNGVEPILVGVPVTSTFRDCVTTEMEASYREFLNQFCRQHHCRFVDYYSALPDSLFFDYHHVTRDGGKWFSRKVTADVLVPLWQGTHSSTALGAGGSS
jgi:hypothetical protein